MKKLFVSILVLACLGLSGFSQAVNDKAVIPVSVNLNQILRLTIISGGNIEFTFNTIADYVSGLNGTQYQTVFSVTSSVDFEVTFESEDADFTGLDDASHTLTGNHVTVLVTGGTGTCVATWSDIDELTGGGLILVNEGLAGAGSGNIYTAAWECGTAQCDAGANSMLGQSADRYAMNVFITVAESDGL